MRDEEGFDHEIISDVQAERTRLKAQLLRAESLTTEDAAREAARWQRVLELIHDSVTLCPEPWRSRYYHIPKDIIVDVDKAIALGPSPDWLARHDAEVAARAVEPWREAAKKMAYNWKAHSAFSSIQYYVSHASNCSQNGIACSCGLSQSLATFRAGRGAIDALLSPAPAPSDKCPNEGTPLPCECHATSEEKPCCEASRLHEVECPEHPTTSEEKP